MYVSPNPCPPKPPIIPQPRIASMARVTHPTLPTAPVR